MGAMLLDEFLVSSALAFMLGFVRMGTAVMIMPGVGDSFVSARIRLLMGLSMAFVLMPLVAQELPSTTPSTLQLLNLIAIEFVIGLFFGTIARIFMTALDVGGMVISFSSSLSNAQMFNPGLASQGSLVGAFLSVTGVVVLFATNLHHLLILGIVETYALFPLGGLPEAGSMAELVAMAVSKSFMIGVQIALPFVIMTLVIYVGMGVLSRLMPQIQVFLLALPLQILLALMLMTLLLSGVMMFWATQFRDHMAFFLTGGG